MAPSKRRTGTQKSSQGVGCSSQTQAPADMAGECIIVLESRVFGQMDGLRSPTMACPEATQEVCEPTDKDSVLDDSTLCPPSPRPDLAHQFPEMVCTQASNGLEPSDKKRLRRESSKKQHSWWYNKHKPRLTQTKTVLSQANKRQHDGATRRQPAKRSKGNHDMVTSAITLGGGREGPQSVSSNGNVASVTVPSDCSQPGRVQQQGSCNSIPPGMHSPLTSKAVAHTDPPQPNGASSAYGQSTSHPSVASETHGCQGRVPPSAPFRTAPKLGLSRSETVGDDGNGTVQQTQQSASPERIDTSSPVESGQRAQQTSESYLDHRFVLSNLPVSPTSYQRPPKDEIIVTADETTRMPCMAPDGADIDPCHLPSGSTVADLQSELANARQQDPETLSITSPQAVALNGSPPTYKEQGGSLSARSEQCLRVPEDEELEIANIEVSVVRGVQELSTAARQQTPALLSERAELRNMLDTTQEERDIALRGMEEWKLKAKSLQDASSTFAEESKQWLVERTALGSEKTRLEAAIEAQSFTIQTLQNQAEVAQAKQAQDNETLTDLRCQLNTKAVEAKNLTKQHEDLRSQHASVKSQNDRLLASAKYFESVIEENSRLRSERDKARTERARLQTVEQEMQALTKQNMHIKAEGKRLQSKLAQDLERDKKVTQGLVDTILENDRLWSTERKALELENAKLRSNLQEQVKRVAVLRQQALETKARQARDADIIKELRAENNGLKSQAQARQTEAQALAQEKQKLSEARNRLQLELEEGRGKVQSLRDSLAHEETAFTHLRLKYEELQRTTQNLQDTFTAVDLKLADSERSQVRLRTEHTELICKLNSEMEKEKTRHASEVDALERERDEVLAAKHDLGLKLDACQGSTMTLKTTVGSLTGQLEAQQLEHASEVLSLQQKNKSMLLKALCWGLRCRRSKENVVELQLSLGGLHTRIAALEASNHTLSQSAADRDATLAEQIRRNQRLEHRNCRSLLRVAACRFKRRLRIRELQESCKYLEDWVEELVTARDNFQGQLELATQRLQDKEEGFQSELDARNGPLLQRKARAEDLEQQLEQAKDNTQRLERDLAAAKGKIQRLLEEHNVQQTSVEEARNDFMAAEDERCRLKASMERLSAQVDEKLLEQDRQVESLENINEQQRQDIQMLASRLQEWQHRELHSHELDVRVTELLREKTGLNEGILRLETVIKDQEAKIASEKVRFETLHGVMEKARAICSHACDAHKAQRAHTLAFLGDEGYLAQQSMAKSMREYEDAIGERDSTDIAFIQDIAVLLKGSEGLTTYLTGRLNALTARTSREGHHDDRYQQSRSSGSTGQSQQPPTPAYTPSTLAPQKAAFQPSITHSPGVPHRPPILNPPISNQQQAKQPVDPSYTNQRFFCPYENCDWGPSGFRVGFRRASFLTSHMTAKHGMANPPKPRAGLPAARYSAAVNQPMPPAGSGLGQPGPVHQAVGQQPNPVFRPINRVHNELPHINVQAQPPWPPQPMPTGDLDGQAPTPGAMYGTGNMTAAPQTWNLRPNLGS